MYMYIHFSLVSIQKIVYYSIKMELCMYFVSTNIIYLFSLLSQVCWEMQQDVKVKRESDLNIKINYHIWRHSNLH